jgi:hypothetical protein
MTADHSGCVSREKYRALEGEVQRQRNQLRQDKREFDSWLALLTERDATIERLKADKRNVLDDMMLASAWDEGHEAAAWVTAANPYRAALDAEGDDYVDPDVSRCGSIECPGCDLDTIEIVDGVVLVNAERRDAEGQEPAADCANCGHEAHPDSGCDHGTYAVQYDCHCADYRPAAADVPTTSDNGTGK